MPVPVCDGGQWLYVAVTAVIISMDATGRARRLWPGPSSVAGPVVCRIVPTEAPSTEAAGQVTALEAQLDAVG
ncbi:hypothetical protein OG889_01835 [Streptomyces sp. NBC_00481]|uniref:hypothetical protein n=1 Tax=unclassified Streptomyces TaxID=2593676 RepID=UPI002DD88C98|nr:MULTISPECIES: hypothetical protein [unclassified Streptomyces]WRY93565.1 hypothetical protein OG889_01835 [Streptomyces sp. NBC_00481]